MRIIERFFYGKGFLLGLACAAVVLFAWTNGQSTKKTATRAPVLRDGDVVFQYSGSKQCLAIAQATHSPYTHCGIVFFENGRPMVWEAVGPVLKTPYAEWVEHGAEGHVVIKRLRDAAPLDAKTLAAMQREGEKRMGRPYDVWFDMDEERIYCSELVWKIYDDGAHLHVGALERFGDMDFSGPEARRILKERFGDRFPADQQVITPAGIFRSPLLFTVDSIGAVPEIGGD